ncbi:MAG: cell division protein FtsQ/DivIB [Actinomycetota bacterium]
MNARRGRRARRAVRVRRRRLRRVVVALLTVGALAVGGTALVRSPLFALDGIEVSGTQTLTRDEVIAHSGLRLGMNVLSVDAGGVELRLEALALVADARVERVYPSKVRIRLEERVPAAAAKLAGGIWLVESTGRLITGVTAVPAGLPVIQVDGTAGTQGLQDGLALWAALPAWARAKTTHLEAKDPTMLAARIGGTRIIFGAYGDLIAKMQAVVAIFDQATKAGGRRVVQIDVRAPRRPAAVIR